VHTRIGVPDLVGRLGYSFSCPQVKCQNPFSAQAADTLSSEPRQEVQALKNVAIKAQASSWNTTRIGIRLNK